MGNHSTNGPVEDLGRSAVVEGTRLFGVDDVALVQEVVVAQLYYGTQVRNAQPKPSGI